MHNKIERKTMFGYSNSSLRQIGVRMVFRPITSTAKMFVGLRHSTIEFKADINVENKRAKMAVHAYDIIREQEVKVYLRSRANELQSAEDEYLAIVQQYKPELLDGNIKVEATV